MRAVLPTIRVPTLVLHRRDDRFVDIRHSYYLAEHIPGARLVVLPGRRRCRSAADSAPLLDEIEEFLTGARSVRRPERILATVMFSDIVDSTRRAAELGDRRWRDLLESITTTVSRELDRFRGRAVKTLGDGFLATFDGPARAIRCATAIRDAARAQFGLEVRSGLHTGEVEVIGNDVGGIAVHIGARVGGRRPARARCSSPAPSRISSSAPGSVRGPGGGGAARGARHVAAVGRRRVDVTRPPPRVAARADTGPRRAWRRGSPPAPPRRGGERPPAPAARGGEGRADWSLPVGSSRRPAATSTPGRRR